MNADGLNTEAVNTEALLTGLDENTFNFDVYLQEEPNDFKRQFRVSRQTFMKLYREIKPYLLPSGSVPSCVRTPGCVQSKDFVPNYSVLTSPLNLDNDWTLSLLNLFNFLNLIGSKQSGQPVLATPSPLLNGYGYWT